MGQACAERGPACVSTLVWHRAHLCAHLPCGVCVSACARTPGHGRLLSARPLTARSAGGPRAPRGLSGSLRTSFLLLGKAAARSASPPTAAPRDTTNLLSSLPERTRGHEFCLAGISTTPAQGQLQPSWEASFGVQRPQRPRTGREPQATVPACPATVRTCRRPPRSRPVRGPRGLCPGPSREPPGLPRVSPKKTAPGAASRPIPAQEPSWRSAAVSRPRVPRAAPLLLSRWMSRGPLGGALCGVRLPA